MTKQGTSAGYRFREAMDTEKPLQIVGAINANHALLASQAGFKAIYLSGGGVAAGSLGIPDLGITTLNDVLIDIERITNVTETPLLVDVDTGFGPSAFNVARTVRSLVKAGAAALHIETTGERMGLGKIRTMQCIFDGAHTMKSGGRVRADRCHFHRRITGQPRDEMSKLRRKIIVDKQDVHEQ